MMDPCRYGAACWRPLCPNVQRVQSHAWTQVGRAVGTLGCQEEYEEDIADVPEPQIMEESLKVAAKDALQERMG